MLSFTFGARYSSSRRVGQFIEQLKGAGLSLAIGHVGGDAKYLRLDFTTVYVLMVASELRSTLLSINVLVLSIS